MVEDDPLKKHVVCLLEQESRMYPQFWEGEWFMAGEWESGFAGVVPSSSDDLGSVVWTLGSGQRTNSHFHFDY